MNLVIIVYRQSGEGRSVQLSRSLHGFTDGSNYGRYSYEGGLLEKIPHLKLMNGVFILREGDADQFIGLLEKYQAKYYAGVFIAIIDNYSLMEKYQAKYYAGPVERTSETGKVILR